MVQISLFAGMGVTKQQETVRTAKPLMSDLLITWEYSYTVGHVTTHTSDPADVVFDQQILELPPQRRTATRSREVST